MTPKEVTKAKIALYHEIVCDPQTSSADMGVAWLLLFKFLNSESGTAWPSAETMAAELRVDVRTVRRAIARLTGPGGYFCIARGGGRGRSNLYQPWLERVTKLSPFKTEKGDKIVRKGCQPCPQRVTKLSPEPLEESNKEPLEARAARSATPNGDARGAPNLKTKKIAPQRMEVVLGYVRQEMGTGIRYGTITNQERQWGREWLRQHGEIPGEQVANG